MEIRSAPAASAIDLNRCHGNGLTAQVALACIAGAIVGRYENIESVVGAVPFYYMRVYFIRRIQRWLVAKQYGMIFHLFKLSPVNYFQYEAKGANNKKKKKETKRT